MGRHVVQYQFWVNQRECRFAFVTVISCWLTTSPPLSLCVFLWQVDACFVLIAMLMMSTIQQWIFTSLIKKLLPCYTWYHAVFLFWVRWCFSAQVTSWAEPWRTWTTCWGCRMDVASRIWHFWPPTFTSSSTWRAQISWPRPLRRSQTSSSPAVGVS